ncbi:MAG TPA: hypothetical protein PKK12_07845 [Candidatus Aminicenantes bacterium]|nr:hypothetical protein [Candidatus Aminicenantes bacterium]
MTAAPRVLVIGASGLLGKALMGRLAGRVATTLAQYHLHPGIPIPEVLWLPADFTTIEGVRHFLLRHRDELRPVTHLAFLYGPLVPRPTRDLTAEDFATAIHHNLLTAIEITRFLLATGNLRGAAYCGTTHSGTLPPLQRVLPYAMAKNALLQTVRSWQRVYPEVRWSFFPLPGLRGGAFPEPGQAEVTPAEAAERIVHRLLKGGRGVVCRVAPAGRPPR